MKNEVLGDEFLKRCGIEYSFEVIEGGKVKCTFKRGESEYCVEYLGAGRFPINNTVKIKSSGGVLNHMAFIWGSAFDKDLKWMVKESVNNYCKACEFWSEEEMVEILETFHGPYNYSLIGQY